MTMNRVIGVTALAGCAALMLAGCGTTHVATGAQPGATATSLASSGRVPADARAVTVRALTAPVNGAGQLPAPVTVTDPAKVQRIVAVVDGMRQAPTGIHSCPMDTGGIVQLVFQAKSGGPAVATATARASGCQGVTFSAGGGPEVPLAGGTAALRQVLAIAGQHWTGFTGPGSVMSHG